MDVANDVVARTERAKRPAADFSPELPEAPRMKAPRRSEVPEMQWNAALACGALAGLGALVSFPIAYLVVKERVAQLLLYTIPVLVPVAAAVCLGAKAVSQSEEADDAQLNMA